MNRKANRKTNTKSASKPSVGRVLGAAVQLVKLTLTESKSAGAVSATQLLTRQHDEVKALFQKLEAASTRPSKVKLFEELAHNLVAHDAIEREIFYPACERAMGMTDLLGEALVEHGVVEFGLYQADQSRKGGDFSFKCQVLKELVLHHVKEEEREFFPKVERALGKPELERLGARMKARFEQVKAADFRAPLHQNLSQVMAGAIKPKARRAKASKKTQSSPTRHGKQRKAA